MHPDRWRQVEELFAAAADLPASQLPAFFAEHCPHDPELQQEVLSLLQADSHHPNFSEAVHRAHNALEQHEASAIAIGPYRTTRLLGSGGMGDVYLAMRSDDQYHAQVAIKLVRAGALNDHLTRRFLQERQILANLTHPNIARLLDGGSDHLQRPYIVMEYVDGQPLLAYAKTNSLSLPDRIRLFLPICDAVHHAHQNLTVHRDIKPGNILVTAAGVPKLLDFGIAKILEPTPTASAFETATLMRVFTPAYASPEQIKGEPITTLTDVYSLGVVLYELLAHRPPYDVSNRSIPEVEQIVCSQPVTRPSAAASNRQLSGDLDNIVLRALSKEPERRYRSAADLAADLTAWLEGRPVSAAPDSLTYLASKFVRRNKALVAAAFLILLSLTAGIVVSTYQARIAARNQARADRRFAQVRKLANTFLFDFHEKIRNLPGATAARELVVQTALEYLNSLAAEASEDPNLQLELAEAYVQVGQIQSGSGRANVGKTKQALTNQRTGLELSRKVAAARPNDQRVLRALSTSLVRVGDLEYLTGEPKAAAQSLTEAVTHARAAIRLAPSPENFKTLGDALSRLSDVHRALGQRSQAKAAILEAVQSHRQATSDPQPLNFHALASSLVRYAAIQSIDGETAAATTFDETRTIREKLVAQYPDNAMFRRELMIVYAMLAGRTQNSVLKTYDIGQSVTNYRKAYEMAQHLATADPRNLNAQYDLAIMGCQLAGVLPRSEATAASSLYDASILKLQQVVNADPDNNDRKSVLAAQLQAKGELEIGRNWSPKGILSLQQARAITLELLTAGVSRPVQQRRLLSLSRQLGDLEAAANHLLSAQNYYQEAIQNLSATALPELSITSLRDRINLFASYAQTLRKLNNSPASCAALAKAQPALQELLKRDSTKEYAARRAAELKTLSQSCPAS